MKMARKVLVLRVLLMSKGPSAVFLWAKSPLHAKGIQGLESQRQSANG